MKKEEVKKIYLRYRLYIFPAVVAISSLILVVFVIYPQIISLIKNQEVEKNILGKSKLLEVKAQTLESYDMGDLSRKVGFALGSYPTDKDSVYALGVLQKVIAQLGFNIVSISLASSGIKNTTSQSYSFKLEILGPVSLLPSLLSSIENSPRLMRVSGVEIGGASTTQQGVNISLAIDMLYASAPAGFGSIDSPLPSLSEKDEEIIAKLSRVENSSLQTQTPAQFGPRGKANPFE